MAEHVLNARALGEIAPFVRVFAEREQFFATIKVAADARPLRVFQWGRTYRGPITIWSTASGAIAIMSTAPVGGAGVAGIGGDGLGTGDLESGDPAAPGGRLGLAARLWVARKPLRADLDVRGASRDESNAASAMTRSASSGLWSRGASRYFCHPKKRISRPAIPPLDRKSSAELSLARVVAWLLDRI